MNVNIRTISLVVLLICFFHVSASAHVTVLLYHKFDEKDSPSTSVPTELFSEQMEYLHSAGYRVMSMEELSQCVSGRSRVPDNAVVITLDDGYLSEYTRALPILTRHGFPFCVFVFTRAVGADNFMNWDQLRQVMSSGGDIGSHTHTHPHLVDLSPQEIEAEFKESKEILEKNLDIEAKWFAYPFGDYDNTIRSIGKKAGYELMLTSDPGSVGEQTKSDIIPRQAIVGQNMNMERFREKLRRTPLGVVERLPLRGRLEHNRLENVSVRILNPHLYHPDQIQMFLSEKGRLDTRFDPITGILSCRGPVEITRKINRIITTARRRDSGDYAMDAYMIVLPDISTDESRSAAYTSQ